MYRIPDASQPLIQRLFILLVAAVTILVCVIPMGELPLWNGEIPGHRNQYELMAEAILAGRIEFAYGDEAELEKLENPYDPDERKASGVRYHWDHAYYKGHYYMYFGIVPVFLAFLPYRILTGQALTTYHGTQLFAAFTIAGIFSLFYLLKKRFFKSMPLGVYLLLSAAFSVMSVWYSSAEPALYCTAITAALALETWSLYFFIRAVYVEDRENRQILYAAVGALLGALVFGCRPPIALANIIVLPLLYVFLRKRKITGKLIGKLALAAAPYAVVGICLMVYNYVRFENPFEFGQAYQLTVADQSNYKLQLDFAQMLRIINGTVENFLQYRSMKVDFPYVQTNGVFFNFPILVLSFSVLSAPVWKRAKLTGLRPFLIGLAVSALVITAIDVMWSPYLLERYRTDIYFLMGIGCFTALGLWFEGSRHKGALTATFSFLSVLTLVSAFLLCVRTVGVYYPEKVAEIARTLGLS